MGCHRIDAIGATGPAKGSWFLMSGCSEHLTCNMGRLTCKS